MNYSKMIRMLRKEKGKTQKEMALDLGIKQSTISAYEKGKIRPSDSMIRKLAVYFNIPLTVLVGTDNAFYNSDIEKDSFIDRFDDWLQEISCYQTFELGDDKFYYYYEDKVYSMPFDAIESLETDLFDYFRIRFFRYAKEYSNLEINL